MKIKKVGHTYWYTFERKIVYFVENRLLPGDEVCFNVHHTFKIDDPSEQTQEALSALIPQLEERAILTKMKD